MRRLVALVAVLTLALCAYVGTASAQTLTPTPTLTATPTATLTPTPTLTATPTATATPTPTATASPAPQIGCGTGPGPGGAKASGICGGVCPNSPTSEQCMWDNTAANAGCICVPIASVCDLGGVGQEMCSVGYCDRPPTMRGGKCTRQGNACRCND